MFESIATTDYFILNNFILLTALFFSAIFFRYLLLAGITQWVLHSILKGAIKNRSLNRKEISTKQLINEVKNSAVTSFIFSLAGTFMVIAWQNGNTRLYLDVNEFPLWYLPISLAVIMFVHETFYYWLHRWMHQLIIYKVMHKTHHDSIMTSALTSFSFHPLESIAQALFLPLAIFLIPMHVSILALLLVIMTVSAIMNHMGVEFYPQGFHRHWLGKWLIGATHHDLHHKKFKCNYGLYFTFWDRWMKTESEAYKIDHH